MCIILVEIFKNLQWKHTLFYSWKALDLKKVIELVKITDELDLSSLGNLQGIFFLLLEGGHIKIWRITWFWHFVIGGSLSFKVVI